MNQFIQRKSFRYVAFYFMLIILLASCTKQDTITFSAEIETISENNILVKTIDYENFDVASVDLKEAEYDFELSEGQIVDITILPEIRESDPIQAAGVKLVLTKDAERNVADYFPIRDNVKYVYEGKGNEFASYEVYTDYTSDTKIQQMVSNGGTQIARVYERKGGKLSRVMSRGEVYYRENLLNQRDDSEEVLLMEPLEKGTTWALEDGRQRTITGISTEVKSPMGTYRAIEVITEGADNTNVDYYAKDIGLVKTIFQSGGMEVSSTLKSIENNSSRVQTIQFYFPDVEKGEIFDKSKEVEYSTNDSTSQILEDAYKGIANEISGVVLSTNAAIKSMTVDEDNKVRLDLNSAFVSEMNAGAEYESMILQCIANTIGNYYNSEGVIITVEGKPYESGHIKMEEGESVRVKTEGILDKN